MATTGIKRTHLTSKPSNVLIGTHIPSLEPTPKSVIQLQYWSTGNIRGTKWGQEGENDPLRYYKEIKKKKKAFYLLQKNVRVSCRDPRIIKRKQEEILDACPSPLS